MPKLVAVGSSEFVLAMAGIGAESVPCEGAQEIESALRRLAVRKDVHVVFVPESLAATAPQALAAFRQRSSAALLGLPLRPSEEHPSLAEVRRLIEKATGASLV